MNRIKPIGAMAVLLSASAAAAVQPAPPPSPPPAPPQVTPGVPVEMLATRVMLCPRTTAAMIAHVPVTHAPPGAQVLATPAPLAAQVPVTHAPLAAQVHHAPAIAPQAMATVVAPVPAPARPDPCKPRESPGDFTAGLPPLNLPPEPEVETTNATPTNTSTGDAVASSSGALTSLLQYSVLNHSGQRIYCAVRYAGAKEGWSDWFPVGLEWTEDSSSHSAAFECGPPVDHQLYPIVGGTKYYVIPAKNGASLEITEIEPSR